METPVNKRPLTEKEALDVIKSSNQKQRDFMDGNQEEVLFDVPRKVMMDNIVAIEWLLKYIDNHCPPREVEKSIW